MVHQQHDNVNFYKSMLPLLLSRIGILGMGLFLGVGTWTPNIMMSDAGTPKAYRAAAMGMAASGTFILGGVVGCYSHRRKQYNNGWWMLLPGLIMQLGALAYLEWGSNDNDGRSNNNNSTLTRRRNNGF